MLLSLWDFCHPAHWPIYGVLIVVCCAFEGLHIFIVSPPTYLLLSYVKGDTCSVVELNAETQQFGIPGVEKPRLLPRERHIALLDNSQDFLA